MESIEGDFLPMNSGTQKAIRGCYFSFDFGKAHCRVDMLFSPEKCITKCLIMLGYNIIKELHYPGLLKLAATFPLVIQK